MFSLDRGEKRVLALFGRFAQTGIVALELFDVVGDVQFALGL